MTNADAGSGAISTVEPTVNGALVLCTSAPELNTAPASPAHLSVISAEREVLRDRRARVRVLALSALGVGCLLLAQPLQPERGSPFAAPSGVAAWTAVICGIVGIWLVPGLWLSAVVMRTGAGPAAWLATRIGTTLAWYALVGPVVHELGRGARVTTGGIVVATTAATAAVCLGVALGLLRWPTGPRLRIFLATGIAGVGAQVAIWMSIRMWTFDMNYSHIRRLDWLIVAGCALLAIVGMLSRPDLPSEQTGRNLGKILVFLAVIATTALALLAIGARWSPAQRMPSAFDAEQIPAPAGADLAFAVTAVGPEGSRLIQSARFTASDDTGRPVAVVARLAVGEGTADRATLLVVLDPSSRPVLCGRTVRASEEGGPVKLTMRDQASGMLVQAVIPSGRCAR